MSILALLVPVEVVVPRVIPPLAGAKSSASPFNNSTPMSGKNLPNEPDAVLYP